MKGSSKNRPRRTENPKTTTLAAIPTPQRVKVFPFLGKTELVAMANSPIFWTILALKIALSAFLSSFYMNELFIPFLNYFVESGFKNPWAYFGSLGHWNAFPYSPIMLLSLAFSRILFNFALPPGTFTASMGHLLAMKLPILIADLSMCIILLRWFPNRVNRVLALYWASPIAIYICYWHGQLDIIPTALLFISLYLISEKKTNSGMVVYAFSLATKTHLVSVLPFLLIFGLQEHGLKKTFKATGYFFIAYALCLAPVIGDSAFRRMVFGSTQQMRLFALQVSFGSKNNSILIAPLAILALLFRFAAYPKWNWDLLFAYLGLLFCTFVLLIPPATGYFLWSFPFVVYFLCRSPLKSNLALFAIYSLSYLAFQFTQLYPFTYGPDSGLLLGNLSFTLMEASLAGITMSMYLFGVRSNAVYDLRTSPVLIGLSGDSGSGKNFFVGLVTDLFGEQKITVSDGDDYHRWPRGHQMWQVYTHLNVRANDLYREHEDAIALAAGGRIIRGAYNHDTGKFSESKPVDPNGILVFSGLHSLSLKSMRRMYDLKVFLDPEEDLRHQWKTARDCKERGYTARQVKDALQKREGDSQKYVRSQRNFADLIVQFSRGSSDIRRLIDLTPFKLTLRGINSFNLTAISQALSSIPTLLISHDPYVDTDWQCLEIAGNISAQEIQIIASDRIPNLIDLAPKAKFLAGLNGCLQLVFLSCLSDQLRWHNRQVKAA